MSIYCTLGSFGICVGGNISSSNLKEVIIQGVPPHIDYVGKTWEWLPPPVIPDIPPNEVVTYDTGKHQTKYDGEWSWSHDRPYRAVVFVLEDAKKGTERCGQEYIEPLLIISGEEYNKITFLDLIEKVVKGYNRIVTK